jgi:hypothetical protein
MEKKSTILRYDENTPLMLTHFAKTDRYRLGHQVFDGENDWAHGFQVDAVYKEAGVFDANFAVGDILHAYSASNKHLASFRVVSIEMCNLDQFDFTRMGYKDKAHFVATHPIFDVKRGWLVQREFVGKG